MYRYINGKHNNDDVADELGTSPLRSRLTAASGSPLSQYSQLPGLCELDVSAAREWHYPTNYEVRSYQLTIVKSALLRNTLVMLPTGLGKTLIAAVVMYNYYRWFPTGKIVFMACLTICLPACLPLC